MRQRPEWSIGCVDNDVRSKELANVLGWVEKNSRHSNPVTRFRAALIVEHPAERKALMTDAYCEDHARARSLERTPVMVFACTVGYSAGHITHVAFSSRLDGVGLLGQVVVIDLPRPREAMFQRDLCDVWLCER